MSVNSKHIATFLLGAAAGLAAYKYANMTEEEKEKMAADIKEKANAFKGEAEGMMDKAQEYFEELGVPTSAHCVGAVAIGYRSAADTPSGSPVTRKRRETGDLVHIGKWTGSVSRG